MKTDEYGLEVLQVDPPNTSKRYSTCGFTHDENRDQESFECQKCGYENHTDYNASKNTGLQYLRCPQKSKISGVQTRREASR
ncbi:Putative transposase DNA-binding domain-containing protein [Halobellus salinus]|nr:Putative transposase DNA-binding domain-containing protein [Halobellus salinus]